MEILITHLERGSAGKARKPMSPEVGKTRKVRKPMSLEVVKTRKVRIAKPSDPVHPHII